MTDTLRRLDARRVRETTSGTALDGRLDDLVVWTAFGVFVAAQLLRILGQDVGPSFDEGIYLTSGLRTLDGQGLADGYLTWFAGSLVWPILGAGGYLLGGLAGARVVALALVSTGLLGALQATANLYGRRARTWAAVFVFGWGAVLSASRVAEYDAVAIAGVGLCAWALTHFGRRDHRAWLVLAAVALFVAMVGKYAAAFCLPAIVGLLLNIRGRRRWADLLIFLLILGALLLAFFLPFRWQLAQFPEWRVRNNPSFGATDATIVAILAAYAAVPTALAFVGLLREWRWDRRVAVSLFSSTLVFPAFHLLAGNVVSANKHIVLGTLLAVPLIGVALERLARDRVRAVVAALVVVCLAGAGWVQSVMAEQAWADARPTVAYLRLHVEPGDLVASNGSWPYLLDLYANGNVRSLTDHRDRVTLASGSNPPALCEFDWFLDQRSSRGQTNWPDEVVTQMRQCGTFELVHSAGDDVTDFGESGYRTSDVQVDVWRNLESP